MFRSARIKLTLAYTLAIAVIMAAFSVALYIAISTAISSNFEGQESSQSVEQAIINAQLSRARLALAGINVAGWAVVASISYLVAGRTLAPLEASVARQRQFTAHASHELRTPLTVIKGEIDVTRARERSPEEYRQTLDRVDMEVVHLDALVSDLLALARMETERSPVERQPGTPAATVAEVIAPFRSHLQAARIELQVAIGANLRASLDWTRIRNLVVNLLANAVHHTPPGGRIEIRGERHGKYLDLTVFNSGSAIDSADLPHIFLPFYRGKGSTHYEGTGLGLALCDWIARSHGGTISAANENGGVAFHVRLPAD